MAQLQLTEGLGTRPSDARQGFPIRLYICEVQDHRITDWNFLRRGIRQLLWKCCGSDCAGGDSEGGCPSFREVAKGWGVCLTEGSFAYILS